jgi:hypothetical protein
MLCTRSFCARSPVNHKGGPVTYLGLTVVLTVITVRQFDPVLCPAPALIELRAQGR